MTAGDAVAHILLDSPLPQLDHLFDYLIPEPLRDQDIEGYLVRVPLRGGKRFVNGWVHSSSARSDFGGQLAEIDSVVSTRPILLRSTYELAETVARRQAGTTSDVLRHIIPQRYVRTEKSFVEDAQLSLSQSEILTSPVLIEPKNIVPGERYAVIFPTRASQSGVPDWIVQYISLAVRNLSSDQSTIICVPDFRDITEVEQALLEQIPADFVIRLDTQQPEKQRYENYLRTLTKHPYIILGNRSAVFSPAHDLASILVWDEADSQMHSPQAPYFSVRDVALVRQAREPFTLIFGSYSRSVPLQRLVELGYLKELSCTPVPTPQVIFISDDEEEFARIPSQAWKEVKSAINQGPILFQVANVGFSTALSCRQCREKVSCTYCHGSLVLRTKSAPLQCSQCQRIDTNWRCPHCESTELRFMNSGSEKTAEEIGKAFPGVKIVLADGNNIVTNVEDTQVIVIATAGAEPRVIGGYHTVVLLDGYRHRLRMESNADEEYLRKCAQAIALTRPTGKVMVVGAGERLGKTLSLHQFVQWAQSEFVDAQKLGVPPAVRSATIYGAPVSVKAALDAVKEHLLRFFGPVTTAEGKTHAVIFFEYREGESVAAALKASIVATATKSRKSAVQAAPRVVELRVKMDDFGLGIL